MALGEVCPKRGSILSRMSSGDIADLCRISWSNAQIQLLASHSPELPVEWHWLLDWWWTHFCFEIKEETSFCAVYNASCQKKFCLCRSAFSIGAVQVAGQISSVQGCIEQASQAVRPTALAAAVSQCCTFVISEQSLLEEARQAMDAWAQETGKRLLV